MTRWSLGSRRRLVVLVALSLVLCIAAPDRRASADPDHTEAAASSDEAVATDPMSPENLAATLGADWYKSTDVAITATMDESGYHLLVGRGSEGFAWRDLATIQPGAIGEVAWTGYHCITGSGRFVVAVVAPSTAANRPVLRDIGAFAYVVSVDTGDVRNLAGAVSLKYHNPGCGIDDTAVVTRSLGRDQASTELLVADLKKASITRSFEVPDQLTSAVPVAKRVMAARGNELVSIDYSARVPKLKVIAKLPGQAFNLLPNDRAGVDLLTAEPGARAGVWRSRAERAERVSDGPLQTVRLFAGRGGRSSMFGATDTRRSSGLRQFQAGALVPEAASLDGVVVIGRHRTHENEPAVRVATADGRELPRQVPDRSKAPFIAVPSPERQLMSPAGNQTLLANTTVPACAVPRNALNRQVPQPVRQQVDWGVQQATRGMLTSANGFSRPANFANLGLAAYSPSSDFSRRILSGGSSSTPIPPSVIQGVMAQESAWRHASKRALPGEPGNPNVSDYYGAGGGLAVIDYDAADCGYGIGQVTTGMRATDTTPYSTNGKTKIAVDYLENIAASIAILGDTWNRLYTIGIRANNSDPQYLENWYFTIWAYNTGINPRGLSCQPSATCTDSAGHWGLGWTNNPRNADYAPNRQGFLRATYADAEHPASWPYQERVFGWMETPIFDYKGDRSYEEPVYASGQDELHIPAFDTFCSITVNSCDPTYDSAGSLSYCTMNTPGHERHCWWNVSISWVSDSCASSCAKSKFTWLTNSSEPSSAHPHPPACNVDTAQLPTSPAGATIIVDDAGEPPTNLAGCSTGSPPARNWTSNGTFTYVAGVDGSGVPLGEIDSHQLGVGFGGHIRFTKGRAASTPQLINTGTWTPTLPSGSRTYSVKVHIPSAGASANDATYVIHRGNGTTASRTINQHIHENRWVSLGNYALQPGAKVVLTNVTASTPGTLNFAFDAVAFSPLSGSPVTHTLDAIAPIDPNQDFDTSIALLPNAKPLNSMSSINELGHQLSDDLSDPSNACATPSHSNPCVEQKVHEAAAELNERVIEAGDDVRSPFVNGVDDTIGLWAGLSNARPPAAVTSTLLDDVHAWKIRHRITVSYNQQANGTIDPASVDVSFDPRVGNSDLMPFIVDFMKGLQTDNGIAPPDLHYTAYDLGRYSHDTTTVDPLTARSVPGRAYKPYLEQPTVTPDGACVNIRALSGGAAGYKPMVLDDAVRASAGAWKERVKDAADAGTIRQSAASAAANIYKFQFKAGNTTDPLNGLNSPWWFAPAIWVQNSFKICTSSPVLRPAGLDGRVAYQSFMPNLYMWNDGTQLIDLQGQNLSPVSSTEARPAQTGDVYHVSMAPASYPPGWFLADDDQGVNLNPWDECDFASPRPRSSALLRNGSPWKLSFYENIEQTPHEVRFCDDAPGAYRGGDEGG